MVWVSTVRQAISSCSLYKCIDYVFGNLQVETQDGGEPSLDTGVYLLSQEVPHDGQVTKVRTCGFLLDRDSVTIPREANEITMFVFVIVYQRRGDHYHQRYTPYPMNYLVDIIDTMSFGCGKSDITNLGWNVTKGDRIGVLVQQIECVQFSIGPFIATTACPVHVNIIDPIKNCSQAHYFANTAPVAGSQMPQKLNIHDGDARNIFINLDVTVGKFPEEVYESKLISRHCYSSIPYKGSH